LKKYYKNVPSIIIQQNKLVYLILFSKSEI
jgi:hypothetical protein